MNYFQDKTVAPQQKCLTGVMREGKEVNVLIAVYELHPWITIVKTYKAALSMHACTYPFHGYYYGQLQFEYIIIVFMHDDHFLSRKSKQQMCLWYLWGSLVHVHLNFELPEPGNHIQKNLNMHLTVHPLRFKYGIILVLSKLHAV